MTKKEINKAIVKRFLTFVEEVFPNYEIDDSGEGGRISFVPLEGEIDNVIEFHRSRLTVDTFNWSSSQTKQDCTVMEGMLKVIELEIKE